MLSVHKIYAFNRAFDLEDYMFAGRTDVLMMSLMDVCDVLEDDPEDLQYDIIPYPNTDPDIMVYMSIQYKGTAPTGRVLTGVRFAQPEAD